MLPPITIFGSFGLNSKQVIYSGEESISKGSIA
jgi:hypothetical protein